MNRFAIITCAAMLAVASNVAGAQVLPQPPGASKFDPPLPQPPPGPKITIPVVPKMDELPSRNYVPTTRRPSFGERFQGCLDAAAAAGMRPGDRAEYARGCANRD